MSAPSDGDDFISGIIERFKRERAELENKLVMSGALSEGDSTGKEAEPAASAEMLVDEFKRSRIQLDERIASLGRLASEPVTQRMNVDDVDHLSGPRIKFSLGIKA